MVKEVYFLLPVDRSIASGYVRALCLKDFAPKNWTFLYIEGPNHLGGERLKKKFQLYRYYFNVLWKIFNKRSDSFVYLIKPSSSFVVFVSRYLFRLRTFVDINDPIHLTVHLGRLSRFRSWLFFNLSNGIVFESDEYRSFLGKRYFNKSIVIEDTPQFSTIYDGSEIRFQRVIWYGSPGTSVVLLEYLDYLRLFNSYGYPVLVMGAAEEVLEKLNEHGIVVKNIAKYQHAELVLNASGSLISFVPMPDIPEFNLRGNLKAKFGMACGCITIASNIEMHRRLISHGVTGYLFNDLNSFGQILDQISAESGAPSLAGQLGNEYVANKFTVENHAKEITQFFESREW